PAAGADVTLTGELRVEAQHVEFDNLTVEDWYSGSNANGLPRSQQAGWLTFRNVRAHAFYLTGTSNVSVLGGSYGPIKDDASQIRGCYLCTYPVEHVT